MSRFVFIADVHIGNHSVFGGPVITGRNDRCHAVLSALAHAASLAFKRSNTLVIAGDLFDTSEPLPQHIAEVLQILKPVPCVVVLRGNHDMVSERQGDHALGPLAALPNVVVVDQPQTYRFADTALLCVPFQTGDARDWFPEAVRQAAEAPRADGAAFKVLTFHLGVVDERTPAYLREAHDAIPLQMLHDLMVRYDIRAAFCGNWHNAREWSLDGSSRKVVQIGAAAPTGFDNPGWDYGKARFYDVALHPHVTTFDLAGPRFFAVDSVADADAILQRIEDGQQAYFTLRGAAADALAEVRARPKVAGARALLDQTSARAATRDAAVAVRQEATLGAALAAFVEKMPVTEGVERARVLALAQKYLTQGAV